MPFKNNVEFPILVDSLIRKNRHHLILNIEFSIRLIPFWVEAFISYLSREDIPYPLQATKLIYLHADDLSLTSDSELIDAKLLSLAKEEKYLLIAFSDNFLSSADESICRQLQRFYREPYCRLIFLRANSANHLSALPFKNDVNEWAIYSIPNPNEAEMINVLKRERQALEKFHQVIIPEEILKEVYRLAEKYLNARDTLEQALLLLDTSAARVKSYQLGQTHHQMKTILTLKTVLQVLSHWTHLPANFLSSFNFNLNDFDAYMKQRVIGQDPAITLLGQALQQSQSAIAKHNAIAGAYLFAGDVQVGKKTCVSYLVEYLFKSHHMLYIAESYSKELISLFDLRFKSLKKGSFQSIKTIINECPYAVLIIENIDEAHHSLLTHLIDLLTTGCLKDTLGNAYVFRHATLILTTTSGSHRLITLNKTISNVKPKHLDLIELVMNEKKQTAISHYPFSPQELIDEILPEINRKLPSSLIEALYIIPFLPLNFESIESIMRIKLTALKHSLVADHGIQFNYAPEILKYLANGALRQKNNHPDNHHANHHEWEIDTILKKLNITIRQAIEYQTVHSKNHRQLLLQLNETGTLLRCEWSSGATKEGDKHTKS